MLATAMPDWNIRQKARMDAHRLRGDYPAEKIEGELNMPDLNEILLSEYGIRRKKARVKK